MPSHAHAIALVLAAATLAACASPPGGGFRPTPGMKAEFEARVAEYKRLDKPALLKLESKARKQHDRAVEKATADPRTFATVYCAGEHPLVCTELQRQITHRYDIAAARVSEIAVQGDRRALVLASAASASCGDWSAAASGAGVDLLFLGACLEAIAEVIEPEPQPL